MGETRNSDCGSPGSLLPLSATDTNGGCGFNSCLLDARSISKSFSGVHALADVSFDLCAGEVHALVGENGAGKSTFIKIVTGAETPDAGSLALYGRRVRRLDPATARGLRIAAIYQQPSLFPHLTVAENIALALEPAGLWRPVRWGARARRATALLDEMGVDIASDRLAVSLSMPEQQIVEIAKALGADARIVIMDEPTASLTNHEVERLFGIIGLLRAKGGGIVYISHRLEEVFAIADRITVLRDGAVAATCKTSSIDSSGLVRLMVGREVNAVSRARRMADGAIVLEARGLSNAALGVRDVSLDVRAGEIVGVAGLVGSGRTEMAETLFGLAPASAGEIRLRGERVRITSAQEAMRLGFAYLPEDRLRHGVIAKMAVAANMSLASLHAVSRWGLINAAAEREAAERDVNRFGIKTPSVSAEVESLSGGNQQKVALARWLATRPDVLILDEPTQGVDVGAKAEIHALIRDLAGRGLAILLISSDLDEVLTMSDRIAVMHAGTIVDVVPRGDATPEGILDRALGHTASRPVH
jgi:rhamnose transport system ATP-binding protein